MDLPALLAEFLARLSGGYALCLALIGPVVPQGPWRRVSLFVIAALCVAGIAAGLDWRVCAATGAAALVLERALAFGAPPATILALLPFGAWMLWPPAVDRVASAVLLGGALGAMLLGHSYLTARGLSFRPLQRMTLGLLVVLVLRAALVLPLAFRSGLLMGDVVYLSMRAAFGLMLALVFAWMAFQCARIRSNQSATGILYVVTALVFMGELVAIYLRLERDLPA